MSLAAVSDSVKSFVSEIDSDLAHLKKAEGSAEERKMRIHSLAYRLMGVASIIFGALGCVFAPPFAPVCIALNTILAHDLIVVGNNARTVADSMKALEENDTAFLEALGHLYYLGKTTLLPEKTFYKDTWVAKAVVRAFSRLAINFNG